MVFWEKGIYFPLILKKWQIASSPIERERSHTFIFHMWVMRVMYGGERIAFLLRVCDHDVGLGAALLYTSMAKQRVCEWVKMVLNVVTHHHQLLHRDFDEGKILKTWVYCIHSHTRRSAMKRKRRKMVFLKALKSTGPPPYHAHFFYCPIKKLRLEVSAKRNFVRVTCWTVPNFSVRC